MFTFIKGVVLLSNVQKLYKLLAIIAEKDKSEPIRKDAALALINLSANKDVALKMTKLNDSDKIVTTLWSIITNKVYPSADPGLNLFELYDMYFFYELILVPRYILIILSLIQIS